ncbi:hypothetical protein HHK36_018239 [Tetracentron sinense]|uniref:MLO-like protein n=1 Tax=Tetracentron sinense TaxID=13715 RepID=A0A834YZR5_TETSI|nr:hypothetical protein HHK36_018224 [Tetracentron sinense]KAF8396615.1 hypothetical protein HHK36_018239 [Tetracentron sinense]
MAGGEGGRSLEETPTWAVAVVCFVLVAISIIIEHIIHLIGRWLKKKHKRALYEALEKIKSELMLMGFLSLLLTVGQGPISDICISESLGATWHPCDKKQETESHENEESDSNDNGRRRLLMFSNSGGSSRRILAAAGSDKCAAKGKVPFVSADGIHQLHIFIFVLAVFHVLYCIMTMEFLCELQMRSWKRWEKETRTIEYQFSHDPERFRFARETSFGRRHLNFWSNSPVLLWIACFFRQFFRSVTKVDYMTLRHGFIIAHLAPQSHNKFDFQKYINRSLEEDLKLVVGIRWSDDLVLRGVVSSVQYTRLAFLFMATICPFDYHPVAGDTVRGNHNENGVEYSRERRGGERSSSCSNSVAPPNYAFSNYLTLCSIFHLVECFSASFLCMDLVRIWLAILLPQEFVSCYHQGLNGECNDFFLIRATVEFYRVLIQFLCSYVTLPLYALVTQMGSTMKPTIFNERVAMALRSWHHTAKKHIKQNRKSGTVTPMSSRPATPSHGMSPVHLLRGYQNEVDSLQTSPRMSNFDNENWEMEGSPPPPSDESPSHHYRHHPVVEQERENHEPSSTQLPPPPQAISTQHEISIDPLGFSFAKR